MKTFRVSIVALSAVMLAGGLFGNVAAQKASKTQWDGVFTDEQVLRGAPLYEKECASCHGKNLEGGEMAPVLAGGDFGANWEGETLDKLVKRSQETMPPNNPGGLTRKQIADVIAFMLSRDGVPAGAAELPTQADALAAIKYQFQNPAAK